MSDRNRVGQSVSIKHKVSMNRGGGRGDTERVSERESEYKNISTALMHTHSEW